MKLKALRLGRIVPMLLSVGSCLLGASLKAQTITWSAPVSFNGLTAAQIFTNTNNTPGTIVGAIGFYNYTPDTRRANVNFAVAVCLKAGLVSSAIKP